MLADTSHPNSIFTGVNEIVGFLVHSKLQVDTTAYMCKKLPNGQTVPLKY
jgi:hypothetical protein